ncbi:hypothetical protein ACFV0R_28935 [Streptomyces sp. NPDC059578]|uniref:hypothetical protein n=1 Tax=Streptomyces sp. NPDC059578 TaxID=3346874 RepID=UPI0036C3D28B
MALRGWSGSQLTLGAINTGGNTHADFFRGTLEEVRIWQVARTREQLLDNLFTRLKGDKKDLLGYWPFDSASTTTSAADHSLRGNHLDLGTGTSRPTVVQSTAPVSTDTAAVRSALATPFHRTISAPPAAAEYADLQYTAAGEAFGVLKRCYSHIKDSAWNLTTGYKVGDLVSEWVSQIQFDPQLIGYIEGAPPSRPRTSPARPPPPNPPAAPVSPSSRRTPSPPPSPLIVNGASTLPSTSPRAPRSTRTS